MLFACVTWPFANPQSSLQSLDARLRKVETALSLRLFEDGTSPSTISHVEPLGDLSSQTTPQALETTGGADKSSVTVDIESIEMTVRR